MNCCGSCAYLVGVFGNFVQCIKTGRFVDYEYWNDIEVEDCPLKDELRKMGREGGAKEE